MGWRPSLYIRLEAIALGLEAIAIRLEVMAIRLEAIALGLEAVAIRLEVMAIRSEAIALGLEAIALGLEVIVIGFLFSFFVAICGPLGELYSRVGRHRTRSLPSSQAAVFPIVPSGDLHGIPHRASCCQH